MRPWNVLVTALEGRRDALRAALRPLGAFGGSGYRNVLVGLVPDVPAFLEQVREELARGALLQTALARVVPVELHTELDPADPAAALVARAEPLEERLGGGGERGGGLGRIELRVQLAGHDPRERAAQQRAAGELLVHLLEKGGHVGYEADEHVAIAAAGKRAERPERRTKRVASALEGGDEHVPGPHGATPVSARGSAAGAAGAPPAPPPWRPRSRAGGSG